MTSDPTVLELSVESIDAEGKLVRASGEIDRANAQAFTVAVLGLLEPCCKLVLDLLCVDFMDLGAMRALQAIRRASEDLRAPFTVVLRPRHRQLVEIADLADGLELAVSRDAALAGAGGGDERGRPAARSR